MAKKKYTASYYKGRIDELTNELHYTTLKLMDKVKRLSNEYPEVKTLGLDLSVTEDNIIMLDRLERHIEKLNGNQLKIDLT